MQWLTVLGSTGSIGKSTLDVVARHADDYGLYALTANTCVEKLLEQCLQFSPKYAVMKNESSALLLRDQLASASSKTEVLHGIDALIAVATDHEVDCVMAAIVGAAGLMPTLRAVESGKKVLLANKESLVMAGSLFNEALSKTQASLLPIDSEHNAMFQCMPASYRSIKQAGIRKLLLTGSGGPFREWTEEAIANATVEQACAHPNWSMGPKISVDSASLMNKGLELIEACWLFNIEPEHVDIVIHPQSVIHSMVEYVDGSVLAQLGNPDMRTPIAHALAWPQRIESGVASLDIIATARLDFEPPDQRRFPCLALSIQAAKEKRSAPLILNAANEVAVAAFLNQQLRFGEIYTVLASAMDYFPIEELTDLDQVQSLDQRVRDYALSII